MRKHSPVVAEIRLDMLPSPIFLLHRFTSLITHFKYNFWHNIHLFTDFEQVGAQGTSHCLSFNKIPLHGFALLERRGHAGGAYIPETWSNTSWQWHQPVSSVMTCIWKQLFPVWTEWDHSETEMHVKLFPRSAEYNKFSRMHVLVNILIIPGNIAMNSTG